jgi:hypothetical protein
MAYMSYTVLFMIIFIIIPSPGNNEAVLIMMNSLKQEHIYKDGLEEDKKEILKFNKLVTYCQNSLHCDTLVEGPINKANQSSDIECQSTAILKGILLRDSKI